MTRHNIALGEWFGETGIGAFGTRVLWQGATYCMLAGHLRHGANVAGLLIRGVCTRDNRVTPVSTGL